MIEFSAMCPVWSEWDGWACILFWPLFWYISEVNEESALWGRAESKIPLFPSVVLLSTDTNITQQVQRIAHQWLLPTYRRSSAVFQNSQPSYCLEISRGWWGRVSTAFLLNTHPFPLLSYKQYRSMNTKGRKSLWKKRMAPMPRPPSIVRAWGRVKLFCLPTSILNLFCRKHEVKMDIVGNFHWSKWKRCSRLALLNGKEDRE